MEIKGRPTIQPWLFYTGKTAGYMTFVVFLLSWLRMPPFDRFHSPLPAWITWTFFIAGGVFITLSLINLGNSVRLGLPTSETTLKKGGIYRLSRNPMYVGLHLLTMASMVYTFSPFVFLAGIFSFWVYHLIILGEEEFLTERFSESYLIYKNKVRRYL